ncbi:MAG: hypothetical protein Q4C56_04665 [Peptococcaceae bacterium]|nr:hypothetical protein [Peptococcaceae bacterium]
MSQNNGSGCGCIIFVLILFMIIGGLSECTGSSHNKYDGVFEKDPNTWTDDEKRYVDDFFEWQEDTYHRD